MKTTMYGSFRLNIFTRLKMCAVSKCKIIINKYTPNYKVYFSLFLTEHLNNHEMVSCIPQINIFESS